MIGITVSCFLKGGSGVALFSAVQLGTVLNLRSNTSQKCETVLRRLRMQGSKTCASLKSRVESKIEEGGAYFFLSLLLSSLELSDL